MWHTLVRFFFHSQRYSGKKKSLPEEASAPAFTQPQPYQPPSSSSSSSFSSSPPPLPTLLHWVSPRFLVPVQASFFFLKPPPPPWPCMKGRLEKGGSVQQANQAFCLCLCRGGEGTLHSGSGAAAAAGAEKEEREGDGDSGRWGRW